MIIPAQNNKILVGIWLEASTAAHDFMPAGFWENLSAQMQQKYLPGSENYQYTDPATGEVCGFISLNGNCIEAIFVLPGFQGRGVGTRLLEFAKSLRKELSLNVYTENRKSVGFYLKNGFCAAATSVDPLTGHSQTEMIWKREKGIKNP